MEEKFLYIQFVPALSLAATRLALLLSVSRQKCLKLFVVWGRDRISISAMISTNFRIEKKLEITTVNLCDFFMQVSLFMLFY